MRIKFSKYHGCGNDFICLDLRQSNGNPISMAKTLCQRGFSVGADGLVGVALSQTADFKMVIINADGSVPEMCGNGLRCFAAYLLELGLIKHTTTTVETGAGILTFDIVDQSNHVVQVRVGMGEVSIYDQLPSQDFLLPELGNTLNVNGQSYDFFPVSVGNPHVVIFVDDVDSFPVTYVGPLIECHSFFPQRTNVEFIQVVSQSQLKMRVWERGVGETNACGTGACAAVVAAYEQKYAAKNALVELRGGDLKINYDDGTRQVLKEGPATFVFSSEIVI